MTGTSPTVRQRELGTRLRELRKELNLTVEDVAENLLCSATKISRLETGARRPSLRDVRDLCSLYNVDEQTSAEFMTLARGAREQRWWTRYDDGLRLEPYIGLEQDAVAITSYSMYYVPPLLQTEEYARTLVKTIFPETGPDIHQQHVETRLRRQQLLEEDSKPRYRVLLDEAVLWRPVGGPGVMAAQLEKVLKVEQMSEATIQVVPFDVGAHAAQDSNFVLLEFEEDSNLPPVVFIEGLTGNQYLERKTEIARYREAVELLRDSALSPRDSIQCITSRRQAYLGGC